MTDYLKLKNAELEALLKQRGLPHGGKKADMVARLEEDDNKTEAPKAGAEDEIDWDDEEPAKASEEKPTDKEPTASSTTTTAPPAAAAPASPAKVTKSIETKTTETATEKEATTDEPAPKAKTPIDFSIGLADSTIDDEIEKRKARAKKFGIEMDPLAEEALRKLERAKKFGEAGGPRGLNEALPERQKRRHDETDERRDFKRRGGRGGRFQGQRRRGGPGAPPGSQPSGVEKKAGHSTSWMTDNDRQAAERRKARFAPPS